MGALPAGHHAGVHPQLDHDAERRRGDGIELQVPGADEVSTMAPCSARFLGPVESHLARTQAGARGGHGLSLVGRSK